MLISQVIMVLQLARNRVIIPSIISQINIDDLATEDCILPPSDSTWFGPEPEMLLCNEQPS